MRCAGHQQRGDGIDQRRFARADVAGEQGVVAVELQRPDAAVEGAPVEHLQAMQAKARERIVGDEIQTRRPISIELLIGLSSAVPPLRAVGRQPRIELGQPLRIDKGLEDAPHFEHLRLSALVASGGAENPVRRSC